MSRLRASLPLLLVPLACAPEQAFPVDPGVPIAHGDADARITETWTSSTRSIALAPVDEALCFLSGVTGRFDKNSDEASVGVQGDRWVVTAATGRSCRLEHPIGAAGELAQFDQADGRGGRLGRLGRVDRLGIGRRHRGTRHGGS